MKTWLIVLLVATAGCLTAPSGPDADGHPGPDDGRGAGDVGGATGGAPPDHAGTDPLSTGTFEALDGQHPDCGTGDRCPLFRVTCGQLERAAQGALRIHEVASPRGLLLLFSGDTGHKWFQDAAGQHAPEWMGAMHDAGFSTVQISWSLQDALGGWRTVVDGERAGPANLACRPATALDHAIGLVEVPRTQGVCGVCLVGFSNGASQATYFLTHYGKEADVDGLFVLGGPVHGDLARGCLPTEGQPPRYDAVDDLGIDYTYGFTDPEARDGPCHNEDEAWRATFDADGTATSDRTDHIFDDVRIHQFIGSDDETRATIEGPAFFAALEAAGSPLVAQDILEGTPHGVLQTRDGFQALRDSVLWQG